MILRSLLAALIAAPLAHAEECERLVVPEGKVITLSAAPNHSTHLTLPEPIVKDVIGNPGLWDAHHDAVAPIHYWIKPTDLDDTLGAQTTLTLLTPSRSFDFVIQRAGPGSHCYVIEDQAAIAVGVVAAPPPAAAAVGGSLEDLFTRYEWRGERVQTVYDDGRFTYVRLAPQPGREIPVIQGGTRKEPLLVHAEYDAQTRTYRVSGIHDELLLVQGRQEWRIRRGS